MNVRYFRSELVQVRLLGSVSIYPFIVTGVYIFWNRFNKSRNTDPFFLILFVKKVGLSETSKNEVLVSENAGGNPQSTIQKTNLPKPPTHCTVSQQKCHIQSSSYSRVVPRQFTFETSNVLGNLLALVFEFL